VSRSAAAESVGADPDGVAEGLADARGLTATDELAASVGVCEVGAHPAASSRVARKRAGVRDLI
jgi:hypothetical protein